jgi:bacillolysin
LRRSEILALSLFLSLAGRTAPAEAAAKHPPALTAARQHAVDALRRETRVVACHADLQGQIRVIYGELSKPLPQGGGRRQAAAAWVERHKALFGLRDAAHELALVQTVAEGQGAVSLKFQQRRAGLPYFERYLALHFGKDGRLRAVTGNLAPHPSLASTHPRLTGAAAAEAARASRATERLAGIAANIGNLVKTRPELGIDYDETSGKARLAYAVRFSEETVRVDAATGKILNRRSAVYEAAVAGTGTNALGGHVDPLNMYAGADFTLPNFEPWQTRMQNAAKGAFNLVDYFNLTLGIVYGMDAQGQQDLSQLIFLSNGNNTFGGPGAAQVVQQAGVSGEQNLETTLNYYKTTFDRNGVNGNAFPVIHVENMLFPGKPLTAQWRFNDSYLAFSIGGAVPATTIVARPTSASLAGVAHELTHGVTTFGSNLTLKNQSGALNESMSDAFAYLVRASVTINYADWVMYPDLFATPVGGCLDPTVVGTKYCRSLITPQTYLQPDRVGGQYYRPPVDMPNAGNDFGYVHTNMGIPNKVFELMIAGGNHYGVDVAPFAAGGLQTSAQAVAQFQYTLNTGGWYQTDTDFEAARNVMNALIYTSYAGDQAKLDTVDRAWYSAGVMTDVADITLDNFTVTNALTAPMTNGILRYDADHRITVGGAGPFVVQAGASVMFCAPEVVLSPGYNAQPGATVTTVCP